MNILDINKHKHKLKEKGIHYTPIDEWMGFEIPINYRCNDCGNTHIYKPEFILKNPTCLNCKRIKKGIEYSDKLKNTTYRLIGDYKNCKFKCLHECKKCKSKRHMAPLTKEEISIYTSDYGCPICNNIKPGHKSLISDYISRLNKFNFILIGEYSNMSTPSLHKCLICSNLSNMIPNNILRGQGCLYCSGNNKKTTEQYIRDLNALNKKVKPIDEYINRKTKIKHLCLKCNKEFLTAPMNILCSNNDGCPNCIISNGENIIKNFLIDNNILFESQKKFNTCKTKRLLPFDFYLPNYNMCIEYDGIQHFMPISFFGGDSEFEKRKESDNTKTNWCLSNNIKLIRIPYYLKNHEITDTIKNLI
jgi:very-short-patch-repair endonuclease